MDKAAYALLGAIVGGTITGIITLFKTFLDNRAKTRIEKLKIHDKDTLDAHKRLFCLVKKVWHSWPKSPEDRWNKFISFMSSREYARIQEDYLYFSFEIIAILERYENTLMFMVMPELPSESRKHIETFLDKEFFVSLLKLDSLITQQYQDYRNKIL